MSDENTWLDKRTWIISVVSQLIVIVILTAIGGVAGFAGGYVTDFVNGYVDRVVAERLDDSSAEVGRLIEARAEALGELPVGTILPYVGNLSNVPAGWVLCGQEGTVNLSGRFLYGTTDSDLVGTETGDDQHGHSIDIRTTGEVDGRLQDATDGHVEYADNGGGRNWFHAHAVQGTANTADHIPPAVRTFFLCKTN